MNHQSSGKQQPKSTNPFDWSSEDEESGDHFYDSRQGSTQYHDPTFKYSSISTSQQEQQQQQQQQQEQTQNEQPQTQSRHNQRLAPLDFNNPFDEEGKKHFAFRVYTFL